MINEMIKIVLVLVGLWFWFRAGRFTFIGAFFFGVFYAFLCLAGLMLYRFHA
jgi:hypothetical protein